MVTPEQKAAYLIDPTVCPFCKSDDVNSHSIDCEESAASVSCGDCGKHWKDVYKIQLVDIEEEED